MVAEAGEAEAEEEYERVAGVVKCVVAAAVAAAVAAVGRVQKRLICISLARIGS
jgi:hypothetical protein